jgi:hypothetical protein
VGKDQKIARKCAAVFRNLLIVSVAIAHNSSNLPSFLKPSQVADVSAKTVVI